LIPGDSLVLLDTNIVLHLARGDTVGRRIDAEHDLRGRKERPLVSVVTAGELDSIVRKWNWGQKKRQHVQELLLELVLVPVTQGRIVTAYGEIDHFTENVQKPARPMGKNDLWIAATAHVTGAALLTSDGDFDHLAPRFFRLVRVDARSGEP
jgi:tRNA(fMet)-specific endonuclease VapC